MQRTTAFRPSCQTTSGITNSRQFRPEGVPTSLKSSGNDCGGHPARGVARLVELDPLHRDVIRRRFEALTGQPARLAGTDQTFGDMALEHDRETDAPRVEAAA